MADLKSTPEIADFYLKQCRERTAGVLGMLCDGNPIPLVPASPADLQPIPVYETDKGSSLLSVASQRSRITLDWPAIPDATYLQAYVKRYKRDGRICNEIVVNTQNYCWARFYVAKELMHCTTDEDGYSATNTFELVNDLVESLISGGFTDPRPQTIVDEIAWIGACECLLPEQWMPMILKVHGAIAAAFADADADLHMAQILRVPILVLRHRMKHFKPKA